MKFSVVIPLYNKAHTILQTIQSVLSQTYNDFEVIIVDDGSTDDGLLLIHENIQDRRVKIIKEANQGVSVARNTGIEASTGDFVSFLDADDEWDPDYLETIANAADENPECGMIFTARYEQDVFERKKKGFVPTKYINKVTEIDYFHNPFVFGLIIAATIKKSLLEHPSLWNRFIPGQKYNEDFFFLFGVALHTRVLYIGKQLVTYNRNVKGQVTSYKNDDQRVSDCLLFHENIMKVWNSTDKAHKSFLVFMRYEFRHVIKGRLVIGKFDDVKLFLYSSSGQQLIPAVERRFFLVKKARKLSIIYINVTKVLWRLHGYPVVR